MADKKTNKLIPIIAIGLIVLTIAILTSGSDKENAAQMQQSGDQNVPDGDTTADTLRTLTALVQEIREENDQLRAEQSQLREELANQPKTDTQTKSSIDALMDQVKELSNRQDDTPPPIDDSFEMDFDIPEVQPQGDVWIEPIDSASTGEEGGVVNTSLSGDNFSGSASDILGDTSAMDNSVGQTITGGSQQDLIIEPVYTIPKNSTFIGSTSMTALMGRVPINGTVEDPYPVKVIVGKDNLTANGMVLVDVILLVF